MLCEELELAAITVAGDQNGHGTPTGPTLACEEPLARGEIDDTHWGKNGAAVPGDSSRPARYYRGS